MKLRHSLFLSSFCLALCSSAQTYYYIDQITVDPAAPTTANSITVHASGNLSSTGSYVTNISSGVSGQVLTITIDCAQNGGLDVLVAHTEDIVVGMLAAGEYTIVLNGTALGDFAPVEQHQFTVTGSSPCDDLIISSVQWSAFNDTLIEVHVFNNSDDIFDYPGFVLLDANGDTVAKENVEYFGIAQESWHLLSLHAGADPEANFTGTLDLWKLFYAEQACSFQLDVDLCPPLPCATVMPYVANYGGALPQGNIDYTIERPNGDIVSSGVFTLTASEQSDYDTLCIAPGEYVLHVPYEQSLGGQLHFGLTTGNFQAQPPEEQLEVGGANALHFSFYTRCSDIAQTVQEPAAMPGITMQYLPEQLMVEDANGSIQQVDIMDASGKLLLARSPRSAKTTIALPQLASGLYIARATSSSGLLRALRFVVP